MQLFSAHNRLYFGGLTNLNCNKPPILGPVQLMIIMYKYIIIIVPLLISNKLKITEPN